MDNRYEIAEQNGMSREFADWFFDNKKAGCGNVWFMMMAAMWEGWQGRAAMLQGADNELQRKAAIRDALCEKYNVESLTDFVDWQRNHIAELEAAPPAPVGPGETTVVPDYPGYVMTQRECYQAGKKAGVAEAGNSPVIPDGWVIVPVEPTAEMISSGIAAHFERSQTQIHDRPAPGPMECAYVAMLAAAAQQQEGEV